MPSQAMTGERPGNWKSRLMALGTMIRYAMNGTVGSGRDAMTMTLAHARTILDGTLAAAREKKFKPLGVAVVDSRGALRVYADEDGSPILRSKIASGKAFGAVAFGAGSRRLHQIGVERPHMAAALVEMTGGALVPVPGGVLIRDKAGALVGAVGVSGDTSDNDEAAAVAGIEAAGFRRGDRRASALAAMARRRTVGRHDRFPLSTRTNLSHDGLQAAVAASPRSRSSAAPGEPRAR